MSDLIKSLLKRFWGKCTFYWRRLLKRSGCGRKVVIVDAPLFYFRIARQRPWLTTKFYFFFVKSVRSRKTCEVLRSERKQLEASNWRNISNWSIRKVKAFACTIAFALGSPVVTVLITQRNALYPEVRSTLNAIIELPFQWTNVNTVMPRATSAPPNRISAAKTNNNTNHTNTITHESILLSIILYSILS